MKTVSLQQYGVTQINCYEHRETEARTETHSHNCLRLPTGAHEPFSKILPQRKRILDI